MECWKEAGAILHDLLAPGTVALKIVITACSPTWHLLLKPLQRLQADLTQSLPTNQQAGLNEQGRSGAGRSGAGQSGAEWTFRGGVAVEHLCALALWQCPVWYLCS